MIRRLQYYASSSPPEKTVGGGVGGVGGGKDRRGPRVKAVRVTRNLDGLAGEGKEDVSMQTQDGGNDGKGGDASVTTLDRPTSVCM